MGELKTRNYIKRLTFSHSASHPMFAFILWGQGAYICSLIPLWIEIQQKEHLFPWEFLVVQWLELHGFPALCPGVIPAQGN